MVEVGRGIFSLTGMTILIIGVNFSEESSPLKLTRISLFL